MQNTCDGLGVKTKEVFLVWGDDKTAHVYGSGTYAHIGFTICIVAERPKFAARNYDNSLAPRYKVKARLWFAFHCGQRSDYALHFRMVCGEKERVGEACAIKYCVAEMLGRLQIVVNVSL